MDMAGSIDKASDDTIPCPQVTNILNSHLQCSFMLWLSVFVK